MTPYQDKVEKLRELAHRLVDEIQDKRRHREEHTRKKAYQATKARIEGNHLDRVRKAALALAFAFERNDLPPVMCLMKWTRATLMTYTATRLDTSGPYQTIRETNEYVDQCKMAQDLRALVEESQTVESKKIQAEHDRRERVASLERATRLMQIPGYFPTPPDIVARMLQLAEIGVPTDEDYRLLDVLEPSAGKGDIADTIRCRGHRVKCVEISHRLCEILSAKDLDYLQGDFLETSRDMLGVFDRVVMNPPFENHQAIDHIMHAFGFLRPGGILVAIMPPSAISQTYKKTTAFLEWLNHYNAVYVEDLPAGAFKDAFVSTDVSARYVTIRKPA